MERYTDSQTWVIVFDKGYGPIRWFYRLWHKEFQHVHLLRDNRDYCLMVNPFAHCTAIREYPNTLFDIIQQELKQNPTAVLQITTHYGSFYKPAPIELLTCVSMVKRILCINSILVLTPKQLYWELIKAGAIVIKPYIPNV